MSARATPGTVYLTQTLWKFDYHNDADKTASNRRGELFTVGDIGYLDEDGYLFLCDRQTDIIISGGVNIYPAGVEAAPRASLGRRRHRRRHAERGMGRGDQAVVQPEAGVTPDRSSSAAPRRSAWRAGALQVPAKPSTSSTSCHATRTASSPSARSATATGKAERARSERRRVCYNALMIEGTYSGFDVELRPSGVGLITFTHPERLNAMSFGARP